MMKKGNQKASESCRVHPAGKVLVYLPSIDFVGWDFPATAFTLQASSLHPKEACKN
jgi:hypothetical protein